MTRRPRHGRGLRASAGSFPSAAVGRSQLDPIVEASGARLTRLTGAGRRGTGIPAFQVVAVDLPSRQQIEQCSPSAVTDGTLLASHARNADATLTVTLFTHPLRLWSDRTGVSLTALVRQTLAEQVAAAVGRSAQDLDPEVD
jgi:hypothetical protein